MVATEVVEPGRSAEAVAEWAAPKIDAGVTVRVDAEEVAAPGWPTPCSVPLATARDLLRDVAHEVIVLLGTSGPAAS